MTVLCRYTELKEGFIIKITKVGDDVYTLVYKNEEVVHQESKNLKTDEELANLPFNECAIKIFESLYGYLGYSLHQVVDEFFLYKAASTKSEFNATIIRTAFGYRIIYMFNGLPCKAEVSNWKQVKAFIKNCIIEFSLANE